MNDQPLVSIITPTYNHELFIGRCINSVLSQTYGNWELIIIDDGSLDRTGAIAKTYKDDRIKYIHQSNRGIWELGYTYNKALDLSRGELIAILEGDDFWPPYKLQVQVPVFNDDRVVLSWGKAAVMSSENKLVGILPKGTNLFKAGDSNKVLETLLIRNYIPAVSVICRKRSLLDIAGFNQRSYTPYVDYATWLELSLIGKFTPINIILGYWQRSESQMTTLMFTAMRESGAKLSLDFFHRLPAESKEKISVNEDMLISKQRSESALGHCESGRLFLIRREWTEAKLHFIYSFNKGSVIVKLKSIIGIVCVYLRIDPKFLYRPFMDDL